MNEFIHSIKPLFPATFNLNKFVKLNFKENAELYTMLVQVGIYLVLGIVVNIVFGILGTIFGFIGLGGIFGPVLGVLGSLVGLYTLAGIVLSVLKFAKVIDKPESADDNKDNGENNA